MKQLTSDIVINAPAARVWEILTDFEHYPEWNPFIDRVEGKPAEGERLSVHMKPPGGMAMSFRPTVLAAKPGEEMLWLGTVGPRGVFDGEHSFRLQPLPGGGVRFTQAERFTGILTPLLVAVSGAATQRGFEAMNQALKQRAEAG